VRDLEVEDVARDPRLSELSTQWTMIFQANYGTPEQVGDALRMMMLRYEGAVHRYFLKVVGDPDVARELDQEFALRFLKGKFLKYDPKLGRFRDYVKRAIRNLMQDHYRNKGKTRTLETDEEMSIIDVSETPPDLMEQQLIAAWRDELLDRAWAALEDYEKRTGQPYHKVLKFRVQNPDLRSPEMAEKLGPVLGQPLTGGALRQKLQRAREQWVRFLVDEVKVSLREPNREAVEEELADLKLLNLCKPVMDRLDIKIEND
jgi:RNA polymerase sigma factor (sigma-70 family)